MRKVLRLLIIILSIFILVGCNDNKKDNKLIELQSSELLNYLEDTKSANIVVALYYDNLDNSNVYMTALNNILDKINNNIYYVNMSHLDADSSVFLYDYLGSNSDTNSYMVLDNGNLSVDKVFKDYKELFGDLKNVKIKEDTIDKIDESIKRDAIDKAIEEYSNGNISISLMYLNKAWDLEEAKSLYEFNDTYLITGDWEAYHILDTKSLESEYKAFTIHDGFQELYVYETKDILDKISRPNYSDYKIKYFIIKDDIIKIKDKEDSKKYKDMYKINYISSGQLQLKSIDTGVIYNFVRRNG